MDKTETKKLIIKMLTENTGVHFLDSGGTYGRHWQTNQEIKNWDKTPEVEFEIYDDGSIGYTISVYHYLIKQTRENLDDICLKFNELQDNNQNNGFAEDGDLNLYGITLDGWGYLKHIIDDIGQLTRWVNTYNYDSNLSQILQFAIVTINDKDYVLLQIHNGCDARGGYTLAKLIPLIDVDYFGLEDVFGFVNNKPVSNFYDGYSLRYTEEVARDWKSFEWLINKEAYVNPEVKDHKIELWLSDI